MTRWEYTTVLVRESTDPANALDSYGCTGWELVSCYKIDYVMGEPTIRFVFKRPVEEESEK